MNISPIGCNAYSNAAFGKRGSDEPKKTRKEKKTERREERVSNPAYKSRRGRNVGIYLAAILASVTAGRFVAPPAQNADYQTAVKAFSSARIQEIANKSSVLEEAGNRFFDIKTSYDKDVQKVGFEAKHYYNFGTGIANIAGRITASEENPDELILEFNDSRSKGTSRYSINILQNDNVEREIAFKNLDNENEIYTYYEFMGEATLKDKSGKEVANENTDGKNARTAGAAGLTYVIPLILSLGILGQLSEALKERALRRKGAGLPATDCESLTEE